MKVRCFSWDSLKLSFIHKCTFLWFAIGYISKAQAIWISRSCEILWKKYRFSWTGQYFTKVQHSGLIMCTMLLLLDTVSNDVWLWHILEYVFCPHWVKWNYGCICISINLCIAFMSSSISNSQKDRKRGKKICFNHLLLRLISTLLKLEISTLYDSLFTFFRRVEISSFRRVEIKKQTNAKQSIQT